MVEEGQADDLYVWERAPAEVLLEKKRKKKKKIKESAPRAPNKVLEKERGREVLDWSRKWRKKKDWDNGYTCVVEKNQEKGKKKGNEWMIERKKEKIQYRFLSNRFLLANIDE